MKKIQLNMNETKKYLVITAIAQGKKTKKRACVELNLSERQINRLLLVSLSTERKRSLQTRKQRIGRFFICV